MRNQFRFWRSSSVLFSVVVGLASLEKTSGAEGVLEGERPPVVTLRVLDRTATEQSPFVDSIPDTAVVAFIRTGGTEESLTVYYRVAGEATPGLDYPNLPGEIRIPKGAQEALLAIEALDDEVGEPEESLVLGLIIPPGLPGVPPPYEVGLPAEGNLVIFDDDRRDNWPPRVAVVSPPDGAALPVSEAILILASAVDPDGQVVSVEFFVDGQSLGIVDAESGEEGLMPGRLHPEWGPIVPFRIVWNHPGVGRHELVAVATDDAGIAAQSPPARVTILDVSPVPVVTVEATDPVGAEVGFDSAGGYDVDPAVFTLHRTGLTERPLEVEIQLTGTAENGVDFETVPSWVEFPAGAATLEIQVLPLDDGEAEGTESLVLEVLAPPAIEIWPPPEGLYWVGRPGQARVVILDNDELGNLPPGVELLHPLDREVFSAPAAIQLIARAGDRDGEVVQVEFFVGDRRIGEGQPEADRAHLYTLLWDPVPAGVYALRAVATDNQGAVQESNVATIQVVGLETPPVVTVQTVDGEASEIPEWSLRPEDPAIFRVYRTGNIETELTVLYQMRGSAQNGVDYFELPGKVTFGRGEESVDVYVAVLPDEWVEGPETVVFALMPLLCRDAVDDSLEGELDRCPWTYWVGEPSVARAVILDDDVAMNRPPRVAITEPDSGAVFMGAQDIKVVVAARDDDGWVSRVALYAGLRLIDEMSIVFIQPPEPGQDQTFEFVWESVPPGAYTLRAKAADNQEAESWSGPVSLQVFSQEGPTVVSVVAADPQAREPGPDGEADPGTFAVYRRGDLSVPLTVEYALGGSAENGIDYQRLTGEVTIPAEQSAARITVRPLEDNLQEGVESVVLELKEPICITIDPPPPECYRVGEWRRAVVRIADRDEAPNQPPWVELVRPREGEVFQEPAEIKIVAAAWDDDGTIVQVEFFADGRKIHEWITDTTRDVRPADCGLLSASFVWTDATVGEHLLQAVATDDEGVRSESPVVSVRVMEGTQPPLVSITATDPYAVEPQEGGEPNTAVFRVRRTGSTAQDLAVWYSVGGTATPGEDYTGLMRSLVIPSGAASVRVVIEPIGDRELEGLETVVLRLELSPMMGPIDPYQLGRPIQACAVIVEGDLGAAVAERLPENGFHVCLPGERGMPYRVEASQDLVHWYPVRDTLADQDGWVGVVETEVHQFGQKFYRIRPMVVEAVTMDEP